MREEGTRITPFHYFCPYMQAIIVHNSYFNVLITWQLCNLQNLEPFLTCKPAEIIVPMDFCRDSVHVLWDKKRETYSSQAKKNRRKYKNRERAKFIPFFLPLYKGFFIRADSPHHVILNRAYITFY